MLWACLCFPSLALDIFTRASRGEDRDRRFVVASGGNAPKVIVANDAARDAGIRAGQSIATALALAPDIVLRDRDPAAEAKALARIATWTLRFTPQVSLAPPDAIVLEIGASLRLFGGVSPLVARLRNGIEAQGYDVQLGIAPTPTSALLLARNSNTHLVRDASELPRVLAPLRLELLDIDAEVVAMLAAAGVTMFGQAASLPRDALARRCGQHLVTIIDRALARCTDPRVPFVPPPRFVSRVELPVPVGDVEALAFGVNRLVHDLSAWLCARGLGVVKLSITLTHEHYLQQRGVSPTHVPFTLGAPARTPAHLIGVLRERLARVALPAPVEAIALESEETLPLAGRNLGLLPGDEVDATQVPLIDRLRARLGDDAVMFVTSHAEHRPEKSMRTLAPAVTPKETSARKTQQDSAPLPDAPRPLWLLDEAEPLQHRLEQTPWVLKDGPERIE